MSQRLRILNIVGARPNLPKIAPLIREMQRHPDIEPILVHTDQHYDEELSDIFFRQMGIPSPHVNLEVGSGSHASQTAEILKRIEPVLLERQPDLVLVVGDVNSTVASLAAVKLGIPVAHVEVVDRPNIQPAKGSWVRAGTQIADSSRIGQRGIVNKGVVDTKSDLRAKHYGIARASIRS
jgi:UDP-N-acetylglucosamine 2-epimerase